MTNQWNEYINGLNDYMIKWYNKNDYVWRINE